MLTRFGAGFYGQVWGPVDVASDTVYRAGPSAQIELLSNLLVHGAFLPIASGPGPRWVVGVQYAAGLWDDFER